MRMKTPTLSMCGLCMGDRSPEWTCLPCGTDGDGVQNGNPIRVMCGLERLRWQCGIGSLRPHSSHWPFVRAMTASAHSRHRRDLAGPNREPQTQRSRPSHLCQVARPISTVCGAATPAWVMASLGEVALHRRHVGMAVDDDNLVGVLKYLDADDAHGPLHHL